MAIVVASCGGGGDDDDGVGDQTTTAASSSSSPVTSAPVSDAASTPQGFGMVGATVTAPDGTVCELCLWWAATAQDRARGLMGVTDLGAADGMAFVYTEPVQNRFYMYRTVMPLSVAFVDGSGSVVSVTDMEPCRHDDASACPRYSAQAPYVVAIEVEQGRLAEFGLAPGSVVDLVPQCPLGTSADVTTG